jgi:hypothetical protein
MYVGIFKSACIQNLFIEPISSWADVSPTTFADLVSRSWFSACKRWWRGSPRRQKPGPAFREGGTSELGDKRHWNPSSHSKKIFFLNTTKPFWKWSMHLLVYT